MGVVNVTADSFSDGGRFLDPAAAVAHAVALANAGADLLDVGGESTRPGARPVPEAEELGRVVPVIRGIRAAGVAIPITIDTGKAAVARAAVAAGASAVNDVTALCGDPEMARTVAELGVPVILMHMAGTPRTMQDDPRYGSVVAEVYRYLEQCLKTAVAHGIPRERLAVDPGIGFGKTARHNLLLIKHLDHFAGLGVPVVLGTSRKRFIGDLLGDANGPRPVGGREWGTAATVALGIAKGAAVLRVHDVAAMADVARLAQAVVDA
ncbi:MAG: dihydropteroate synthase [Nitrospirae bacterium]|nr:dihydropteroate synthase [Nitrospirota bacterium]